MIDRNQKENMQQGDVYKWKIRTSDRFFIPDLVTICHNFPSCIATKGITLAFKYSCHDNHGI
jgi:hypothetical protein